MLSLLHFETISITVNFVSIKKEYGGCWRCGGKSMNTKWLGNRSLFIKCMDFLDRNTHQLNVCIMFADRRSSNSIGAFKTFISIFKPFKQLINLSTTHTMFPLHLLEVFKSNFTSFSKSYSKILSHCNNNTTSQIYL